MGKKVWCDSQGYPGLESGVDNVIIIGKTLVLYSYQIDFMLPVLCGFLILDRPWLLHA